MTDYQKLEKSSMDTEPSNYQKIILNSGNIVINAIILVVSLTMVSFYEDLHFSIQQQKVYEKYQQECGIFIERAGAAGTIRVARVNLDIAVVCLPTNYPPESFEYKNLKENLDFLKTQPENSSLPTTIKESIQETNAIINKVKIDKINNSSSTLSDVLLVILMVLFMSYFILFCMLKNSD